MISGEERVEVPAGKYTLVKIVSNTTQNGGQHQQTTCWHAPAVGLIKSECGEQKKVLKSFTPGKD